MRISVLKSKIHRAKVTEADINYIGSITIDTHLMNEVGIYENEKVQVVNVTNGERFETYAIGGEEGSGVICVNGAAARLVQKDDIVIIMAYCTIEEREAISHRPKVVLLENNQEVLNVILK